MLPYQEKAMISARFIETLLDVPVQLCENVPDAILRCIAGQQPEFVTQNFSEFLTAQRIQSFQRDSIYRITDFTGLNFNLFLYGKGAFTFLVGPYLSAPPDAYFCERILQKNHLNHSLSAPLHHFYLSLPVISNSAAYTALHTAFCTVNDFEGEILYQNYQPQYDSPTKRSGQVSDSADDAHMELLEQRYYFEKRMLQEVRLGNLEQALYYSRKFFHAGQSISRTPDPLRNQKNLTFSLNTMLRKSAEDAGIHPVYLNSISSEFAVAIENVSKPEDISELQTHMIRSYSLFVQKYQQNQYSPLIRRAITYIHIHLADSLTLAGIASGIKVSPSYLSRVFNQEVQESLPNYITKLRIEKAAELLSISDMSIQDIAAYVGFSDLNYFSRCFKKYKKVTPTEYKKPLR